MLLHCWMALCCFQYAFDQRDTYILHFIYRQLFKSVKTKAIKAIEHGFKYEVLLMTENGERLKLPKDWYTLTFKEFKSIMG